MTRLPGARASRAALCLWGAVLSPGCSSYVPASLDSVPVGASVRALLSTQAERVLHDSFGLDVRAVRGTLVERQDTRLLFQVRTASGSPAFGAQPLYQRIALSPRDVVRVDVKRFHRVRSASLIAAVAAATTILVIEAVRSGNPGTPEPPGLSPHQLLRLSRLLIGRVDRERL